MISEATDVRRVKAMDLLFVTKLQAEVTALIQNL